MGGWNYEALKQQPHTLGGTPRLRGGGALNREGLTYKEWLAAAGAISTGGQRISEVLDKPHLWDNSMLIKNFSRDLRREWRHGVDPTEYRNYFDEEWRRLEEKRAERRTKIRAELASRRLTGDASSDVSDYEQHINEGEFYVGIYYRFRPRKKT